MSEVARKGLSLQWQMLAGFAVGLIAGLIAYSTSRDAAWVEFVTTYITGPIGQVFLRLLFMLVIPLLFSALVVGISEMGEIKSLKRVGLRTLVYTVLVSAVAVAVSLVTVNLLQPGAGVDKAAAASMLADSAGKAGEIISKGADPLQRLDLAHFRNADDQRRKQQRNDQHEQQAKEHLSDRPGDVAGDELDPGGVARGRISDQPGGEPDREPRQHLPLQ